MRFGWLNRDMPGNNGEECLATPFHFFSYSKKNGYLINRLNNTVQECTTRDYSILEYICFGAGKEEHIANIAQLLNTSFGAAAEVLLKLEKSQWVLSSATLYELLKQKYPSGPTQPPFTVSHILTITKNRIEQAAISMQAFIESVRDKPRALNFTIVDDTDDPVQVEKTSSVVKGLAEKTGQRIQLVTQSARIRFLKVLKSMAGESRIPLRCIETAFEGFLPHATAHGRNRNWALAAAIDEVGIYNDDDILPLYTGLQTESPIKILCSSDRNPQLILPFLSRDAIRQESGLHPLDWLEAHEQLLGLAGENLTRQYQEAEVSYDGISMDYLYRLLNGKGEVVATNTGICGDYAGKPPSAFLFWPFFMKELDLKNKENYYAQLLSGEILSTAPLATITDAPSFTSMQSALNGHRCLPPFFPHFTGEDTIFGSILQKISTDYLIGHIPYGVFHDRQEKRPLSRQLTQAESLRFSLIMNLLVNEFPVHAETEDTGERMKKLGQYIAAYGELSEKRFTISICELYARNVSNSRSVWELLLIQNKSSMPGWFLEDLRLFQLNQMHLLESNDCFLPVEFNGPDSKQGLDNFRLCLIRYGELLYHWPALFQLLKTLKNGKDWFTEVISP